MRIYLACTVRGDRGGVAAGRAICDRLREAGINARGEVGDADPLQAIEDALRTFGADEIVISTHPVEFDMYYSS